MLLIDGAWGEGGGQVLRTSLSLSLLTGKAFRIARIRGGRPRPGLAAQHLAAVRAAAAIGGAQVSGDTLGSQEVTFTPASLRPGSYQFQIGTAGACTLVLQTILIPLTQAGGSSRVLIHGGTHVPWSPSYHYLQKHWSPCLEEIGFRFKLRLLRAGFYPQGGGTIESDVEPATALYPLHMVHRGSLQRIQGLSLVARLHPDVARRQREQAWRRLRELKVPVEIEVQEAPAASPGSMLLLQAFFESSRCCYFSLGAKGKPAEQVADEAAGALLRFLATPGAVDPYLGDQLMLPLVLAAGESALSVSHVSSHILTNARVIEAFCPGTVKVEEHPGGWGILHICGSTP